MADALVVWHAEAIVASTRTKILRGMNQGGQRVVDATKRLLNRSQATRSTKSGRRVGLDPSKPGEPPKRLESQLIQSIVREDAHVEGNDIVVRVGTNLKKARRLELGFVGTDALGRNISQAPRPYLRRALAESREQVAAALSGVG